MILIRGRVRPVALLCALALLLVACADNNPGDDPTSPGNSPRDEEREEPAPDPSADDEPEGNAGDEQDDADDEGGDAPQHAEPEPAGDPYEPVAGEVRPNAKRLAARIVEQLTTYEVDESPDEVVADLAEGELADQVREAADPVLHDDAWSRGEVVYPQLGGMLDHATSVMVVIEQTVGLPDGEVIEEVRTLDVRLGLHEGAWALGELASAGGEPVARPDDLPEVAEAVLDDERIDLPDTAVWDIHMGAIDEELLTLMLRMAGRFPYQVVVFDTGHPWEVFGTDRQSKHSRGQAVDIHALGPDGNLVLEERFEGSTTHELVRWLYDQPELSEVGSPWALDGFGGRSFTDPLHQDHLHVAVGDR